MSDKNVLQEILMKRGIPPPKYETIRTGGQDHAPLWKSKVSFQGHCYESEEYYSKKEAEQNAARIAYESLDISPTPLSQETNINSSKYSGSVLIIDVENRPKDYDLVRFTNIDTYLVISSGHALEAKIELSRRNHRLISVPTMQSNGADMGIIVLATMLRNYYDRLIIISTDKFVLPMPDCLSDISYIDPNHTDQKEIKIYRNINQFLSSS